MLLRSGRVICASVCGVVRGVVEYAYSNWSGCTLALFFLFFSRIRPTSSFFFPASMCSSTVFLSIPRYRAIRVWLNSYSNLRDRHSRCLSVNAARSNHSDRSLRLRGSFSTSDSGSAIFLPVRNSANLRSNSAWAIASLRWSSRRSNCRLRIAGASIGPKSSDWASPSRRDSNGESTAFCGSRRGCCWGCASLVIARLSPKPLSLQWRLARQTHNLAISP